MYDFYSSKIRATIDHYQLFLWTLMLLRCPGCFVLFFQFLNLTFSGGVPFGCWDAERQWTHLLLYTPFSAYADWLIFWACAKQRGTRHETAQTGEMCHMERGRNYEWHCGGHGAECYKLKVCKREHYKPLLWENCIFSSLKPTAELESALRASNYSLNWKLLPPVRCGISTLICILGHLQVTLTFFDYPYPPFCCGFYLFLL